MAAGIAAERADAAAVTAQEQAAAADTAATAANTAAAGATLAKVTAETAAVDATAAADRASTAAAATQEQATAAEIAAGNANAAAQGADTARDAAKEAAAAANQAAAAAQEVVDTVVPEVQQLKQSVAAETRRAQEAEDNRIKKFYTNNLGAVNIADSDDGAVRNLVIYGKSEQGANPSPENPQEIESVVNSVVKVCGKNLLIPTLYDSITKNGVTMTGSPEGTYTVHGTAAADSIFYVGNFSLTVGENNQYKLSGCPKNGSTKPIIWLLWTAENGG